MNRSGRVLRRLISPLRRARTRARVFPAGARPGKSGTHGMTLDRRRGLMNGSESMPERLRDTLRSGLLGRLPLTFLPFVNQQISEWEYLFPNERQSTERLLLYVDRLSPEQAGRLFADVVRIEEKMGVRQWQFSTDQQTIQNASELARSPYYRDWRQAVQAVYDEADQNALAANAGQPTQRKRAIVLDIPRELPVEQDRVWLHWQELGTRVRLERSAGASAQSALDRILAELLEIGRA